jgi:hypothetical protein
LTRKAGANRCCRSGGTPQGFQLIEIDPCFDSPGMTFPNGIGFKNNRQYFFGLTLAGQALSTRRQSRGPDWTYIVLENPISSK